MNDRPDQGDLRPPEPVDDDRSRDTPGTEVVRRVSALPVRRPPAEAEVSGRRRIVLGAVSVVADAATHERTVGAVRWLVRNVVVYPVMGVWVLVRRWWEARTNARYERLMRAAEAAGDYERLTDWEQRAEQARERRHHRRMDWITAPLDLARAAAVVVMWGIGSCSGSARSWPSRTRTGRGCSPRPRRR
jgi:hypothetical protein